MSKMSTIKGGKYVQAIAIMTETPRTQSQKNIVTSSAALTHKINDIVKRLSSKWSLI